MSTAAAIPTVGTHSSGFDTFRLLTQAAFNTAFRNGALSVSCLFRVSNLNRPSCSFEGDLRQQGFFFEQRSLHSRSICFNAKACSSLRSSGFCHAALAICLYVPLMSIFPRLSKSPGRCRSLVSDGHSTFTDTGMAEEDLLGGTLFGVE